MRLQKPKKERRVGIALNLLPGSWGKVLLRFAFKPKRCILCRDKFIFEFYYIGNREAVCRKCARDATEARRIVWS